MPGQSRKKNSLNCQSGDTGKTKRHQFLRAQPEQSRRLGRAVLCFAYFVATQNRRSWQRQRTSGLFGQRLQVENSFYSNAVGELPGWITLDPGFFADVILRALSGRTALNIIDIVERVAEEFLLVGAVRAPPGAVH